MYMVLSYSLQTNCEITLLLLVRTYTLGYRVVSSESITAWNKTVAPLVNG
jgi:hypothetical protein